MKKLFSWLGIAIMIPLAIVEYIVKFVWSIIFHTFKPIFKQFPDSYQGMKEYATDFGYLEACGWIYEFWEG